MPKKQRLNALKNFYYYKLTPKQRKALKILTAGIIGLGAGMATYHIARKKIKKTIRKLTKESIINTQIGIMEAVSEDIQNKTTGGKLTKATAKVIEKLPEKMINKITYKIERGQIPVPSIKHIAEKMPGLERDVFEETAKSFKDAGRFAHDTWVLHREKFIDAYYKNKLRDPDSILEVIQEIDPDQEQRHYYPVAAHIYDVVLNDLKAHPQKAHKHLRVIKSITLRLGGEKPKRKRAAAPAIIAGAAIGAGLAGAAYGVGSSVKKQPTDSTHDLTKHIISRAQEHGLNLESIGFYKAQSFAERKQLISKKMKSLARQHAKKAIDELLALEVSDNKDIDHIINWHKKKYLDKYEKKIRELEENHMPGHLHDLTTPEGIDYHIYKHLYEKHKKLHEKMLEMKQKGATKFSDVVPVLKQQIYFGG